MKVFISYAREDWEIAEKVWSDLKRAGIDAWIDRKELLPGQSWKTEISKAIKASSHFIALLSTRSVSKQGFFHTELKKAIDVLDTFPEHRIYFIPVRIDDCEPGYERLGDIHWADLFPSYEEGLYKILKVLKSDHTIRPKYQLRKELIVVLDEEVQSRFRLNENWQPLGYINNDYRDNGDGTITDDATDLMWQKSYMPCENISAYIEELNINNFVGYTDWRLPTVDEMASLFEIEKQSNDLYINPIFESEQGWFWTSDQSESGLVWRVRFSDGLINWLSDDNYIRVVRSIQ